MELWHYLVYVCDKNHQKIDFFNYKSKNNNTLEGCCTRFLSMSTNQDNG